MNTCATCSNWTRNDEEWESKRMGYCRGVVHREKLIDDVGSGSRPGEHAVRRTLEKSRAYVVDASGYHAELHTHEKFGCALHQPVPVHQAKPRTTV